MKEERFPHTRKPLHMQRQRVVDGGSFGAMEENTDTGVRRAKQRDSRTEARPSSTHQPERLACSPAGVGGGWELRLRLRSDCRERTGVGGVNTA